MLAKDSVVGHIYLTAKAKIPVEVISHDREAGEGPVIKIMVRNCLKADSRPMVLAPDYEIGDEITAEDLEKLKTAKATPPAVPAAPAPAQPAAPKSANSEEEEAMTKKKAAKKAVAPKKAAAPKAKAAPAAKAVKAPAPKKGKDGAVPGRRPTGTTTRSGIIDKMLLEGKHTRAQIVKTVMDNKELAVPAADASKVAGLVSVRVSRFEAAGATYENNKDTKILKITKKK